MAATWLFYVGEQKACAGCKTDDGGGVQAVQLGLFETGRGNKHPPPSSARLGIHLHTQPPTPPTIHLLLPTIPLPVICLRQRGFSSFFRALKMPFTSVGGVCSVSVESRGARAETRAGGGRLSGWRAVCDALRSTATAPLPLRRAWQALP